MAALDFIWNLKFIKGYRTLIAKTLIAAIGLYQYVSTSQAIIGFGLDLPDLPASWSAGVLAYLALKIDQFAKEHA